MNSARQQALENIRELVKTSPKGYLLSRLEEFSVPDSEGFRIGDLFHNPLETGVWESYAFLSGFEKLIHHESLRNEGHQIISVKSPPPNCEEYFEVIEPANNKRVFLHPFCLHSQHG